MRNNESQMKIKNNFFKVKVIFACTQKIEGVFGQSGVVLQTSYIQFKLNLHKLFFF